MRGIFQRTTLYFAAAFWMAVSAGAFADHDSSIGGGEGQSMPRPPKATLAIGAALDEGGRLWVAKVENQRLLVFWSDDGGKNFSIPVQATPEPENILADGENRPRIAIANDGTVLLTWVQSLPQKYSGNVRFARSTDSGQTFSPPITLNDDGRITSHRFASMAIDGMGRVVIAWLDARDRDMAKERGEAFSGVSIYTARSSDNGASFGPNRRFQTHTCECCRIALTWTPDGPVAFWRNIFGTNTRDFAIANLDKGGIRRATDDDWQIDACPHNGGSMASGYGDQLHLVWFTDGSARRGIFYKHIDGNWQSPAMRVGNPSAQASHASVAAFGKIVLLTWREFDGNSYSAELMYSTDAGSSWSKPMRLMESSGATDYPIPLIDAERVLIVWNTAKDGLRITPIERVTARRAR